MTLWLLILFAMFVALLGMFFATYESEYERNDRRIREHSDRVKAENVAFADWKHMSYEDAQWFAANGYDNPLKYFDTMRMMEEVKREEARRTVTAIFRDPLTGKSVTGAWKLNPDGSEHVDSGRWYGWSL